MIEAFKSDKLIDQFGGRFKLSAFIQRRWLELLQGERPLVDPKGMTELEVVVREIIEGKIKMEFAKPEEIQDGDDA